MTSEPFTGPHGETIRPTPVVPTHLGGVKGLEIDGISRFLGIRYAAPPLAELRFKPPIDPEPWSEPVEAVYAGPPAMQSTVGAGNEAPNDFVVSQMTAMPTARHVKLQSEDCLYVNVWTPGLDDARRPVLVWFHGGAFAFGSGDEPMYEGSRLSRRGDIVVVTISHRLNIFGFMDLASQNLDPHYDDAVNVGLLDLVHALTWVKKNIAAFGGDPDTVTIAGESGGGGKVTEIMGMPAARGLFRRAIAQSGTSRSQTRDQSAAAAAKILAAKGITSKEALLNATSADLVAPILPPHLSQRNGYNLSDEPLPVGLVAAVDGSVVPASPFWPNASEVMAEVDFMTGYTKDEFALSFFGGGPEPIGMTEDDARAKSRPFYGGRGEKLYDIFARLYPDYVPAHLYTAVVSAAMLWEMRRIAAAKARQGRPVYVYQLSFESTVAGGVYRSAHAVDLPLMWDNVPNSRAFIGEGDDPMRMAEIMSEAWIAFIRTGDPSTPAIGAWPGYTADAPSVMELDLESGVLDDRYEEVYDLVEAAYQERVAAGATLPYE